MNSLGTLRKRNRDNRYYIDIVWNGKRHHLYNYNGKMPCLSKEMGQQFLQLIRAEIDREQEAWTPERHKRRSPIALKKYAIKWINLFKSDWSKATLHDYNNSLNNHILPILGNMLLPDIKYDHIKELQNSIKRSPKGTKNVLDCLKTLLKSAKKSGLINKMPEWVEFKGQHKIVNPPIRYISGADQIRILEAIPQHHRPIFAFMMATGCRPSEARAFRKKDIRSNHIMFEVTFGRDEELKPVKQTKAAPFPLTNEIKAIIDSVKSNLSPFVFVNPTTDKPYSKNITKIWNKACRKAEMRQISLYQAVRHSFACQLLNANVDRGVVSKLLRHSDPRMIDRYGEYQLDTLTRVVDNVRKFPKDCLQKRRNIKGNINS